jgi:hypothetical protein
MSFKELSGSDSLADQAKAEHETLIQKLRSKQITVVGDFTPQTAGLALAHDAVLLKGGPFDGTETKVPRGAAQYERPAASTRDGDPPFVPARYFRTKQRSDDGLTIFQFQADQPAA